MSSTRANAVLMAYGAILGGFLPRRGRGAEGALLRALDRLRRWLRLLLRESHRGAQGSAGSEGAEDASEPAPAAKHNRKMRVLLADDHLIFRQALRSLLEQLNGVEVAGEASTGEEAVQLAQELRPDVVIMDVSMPRMNGVEATRRITSEHTCHDIVGLSMHREEDMAKQMQQAGARTYLTKDQAFEKLAEAVKAFGHQQPGRE